MKKLSLCLALALVACGPSTPPPPTLEELFPANNEVGAWTEDTSSGAAGVETAKTTDEVFALINGDAQAFVDRGFVAFGRERYTDGTHLIDLRVWQLKSSTAAMATYDALVLDAPTYKANTWTELTVGHGGRIADTGSTWWVNAHDGVYIIEVKAQPKDDTSRADAEAFAKAVADKIP